MKKQSIDYLFFAVDEKNRNRIRLYEQDTAGMKELQVNVGINRYRKWKNTDRIQNLPDYHNRFLKKIKRKLKKYNIEKSVMGADRYMAELLQMEDVLFQARKQELLTNRETIMWRGKSWIRKTEQMHCHMLLVIDSGKWTYNEIRSILFTAKNCYENISIYSRENNDEKMELYTELYEEWGVVLHRMTEEEWKTVKVDFVLLLLEDWNWNLWRELSFHVAYIVADTESEKKIKRYREKLSKDVGGRNQRIYSGFVYEKQGKQLYYQQGINIAFQNPDFYEEFQISIVAIYRLEW